MTNDPLIFVGLNGYALALHRDTGDIGWSNNQRRSGYVTFLLDGHRLIVSTNGYSFRLDPLTGVIGWENPLRGHGTDPTSPVSVRGQVEALRPQQVAGRRRRDNSESSSTA